MEELRSKHKSLQSAAHHIALECINPQDARSYGTPSDSPVLGRALCLTPRGSPVPGRVSHLSERLNDSLTLAADTDALVTKISAMFPTVTETHIKILLKKYYNREAVVISALQVEKHPITTPGPLHTSPGARLQRAVTGAHCAMHFARAAHADGHYTPLSGTPNGSPMLLRPASGASSYYGTNKSDGQPPRHHSPKMKLKYLKSIFPKAEETFILDVLANKDNNVQKASEELLGMGFAKKEATAPPPPPRKNKETPQPPKKVVTIMKTLEEKNDLKRKLQQKYSSMPERVVSIALESAEYNEERAEQILSSAREEPARTPRAAPAPRRAPQTDIVKGPILKAGGGSDSKYKSPFCSAAAGPNPVHRKGPKDSLLLEDYMAWTGPNPDMRAGQAARTEGPGSRGCALARGPAAVAKGPAGIARGSIYQKLAKKSAKIVV